MCSSCHPPGGLVSAHENQACDNLKLYGIYLLEQYGPRGLLTARTVFLIGCDQKSSWHARRTHFTRSSMTSCTLVRIFGDWGQEHFVRACSLSKSGRSRDTFHRRPGPSSSERPAVGASRMRWHNGDTVLLRLNQRVHSPLP